jgi:HEPN domain-containing protein
MPSSRNAREFYRAAKERFEDAELIFSLNRTTAAVYLGRYPVEFMLKALILSAVPRSQENAILGMFRGKLGHDYDWLMRLYRRHGGSPLPQHLTLDFVRVRDWSTDMRYSPATIQTSEAKEFLRSVTEIIKWADGRL